MLLYRSSFIVAVKERPRNIGRAPQRGPNKLPSYDIFVRLEDRSLPFERVGRQQSCFAIRAAMNGADRRHEVVPALIFGMLVTMCIGIIGRRADFLGCSLQKVAC